MAQTAFSIRMDEGLKRDFSQFCENIGMTMSTAFVVFAKAALRSRKIPFEIKAAEPQPISRGMEAFMALREEARKNGVQDMTLDEINEEIRQSRAKRDGKK